jgi:hypothetical protein
MGSLASPSRNAGLARIVFESSLLALSSCDNAAPWDRLRRQLAATAALRPQSAALRGARDSLRRVLSYLALRATPTPRFEQYVAQHQ